MHSLLVEEKLLPNVNHKKDSGKLLDRSNTFSNSIASLLIDSFGKTDNNLYWLPQNSNKP